jgi:hypothetical protein
MSEEEELYARFAGEMNALLSSHEGIQIQLDRVQCFFLLGQLQLALKHPENTGASASFARTLAKLLQDAVSVSPAIAAVAERGWHE